MCYRDPLHSLQDRTFQDRVPPPAAQLQSSETAGPRQGRREAGPWLPRPDSFIPPRFRGSARTRRCPVPRPLLALPGCPRAPCSSFGCRTKQGAQRRLGLSVPRSAQQPREEGVGPGFEPGTEARAEPERSDSNAFSAPELKDQQSIHVPGGRGPLASPQAPPHPQPRPALHAAPTEAANQVSTMLLRPQPAQTLDPPQPGRGRPMNLCLCKSDLTSGMVP